MICERIFSRCILKMESDIFLLFADNNINLCVTCYFNETLRNNNILHLFSSCKATYKNVTGTYVLENVPKTRLIINSDTTFKFIKVNQNPYLYTDDHPDQRFYFTTGHFYLDRKNLLLTSNSDSLVYDATKSNIEATKEKYSEFTFNDIYNDSVGAGYVILPDSSTFISGFDNKKDIYHFGWDMTKANSLEFFFYGYGHWKYSTSDKLNYNITV